MIDNYKVINEIDFINNIKFPSNDIFNGVYNYRGRYAIAEFNQKFVGSIILKSRYFDTLENCLNEYDIKKDILFCKIIIKYNLT